MRDEEKAWRAAATADWVKRRFCLVELSGVGIEPRSLHYAARRTRGTSAKKRRRAASVGMTGFWLWRGWVPRRSVPKKRRVGTLTSPRSSVQAERQVCYVEGEGLGFGF